MTDASARRGTRLTAGVVRFSFDGRQYIARAGDTAASALLANGVMAFGRSVKYRRLRGVLAAGPEEPSALLTVGVTPTIIPNVPAPQVRLRDGMVLHSQNRWPSLHWDLASALQAGGGFLGAGFYYKTFMWPSWRTYEPLVRSLAGLGQAPTACDLPTVRVEHLSCDLLVAGAGPAGLAAALAAARAGARVVVVEREPVAGGELEYELATIDHRTASDWVTSCCDELRSLGVHLYTDTTLVGGTDGLYVANHEPGGIAGANTVYKIRPRALVWALGAVERPIAFVDNDRPGVMLLGAAERFSARYGALVGRSAVLFANHDRVYAAALRLRDAGVRVQAIIDTRVAAPRSDQAMADRRRLQTMGVECLAGHAVLATIGRGAVRGASVAPLAAPASRRIIDCDLVLVSGGWSPASHAAAYAPGGRYVAGAARSTFDLQAVLDEGTAIGRDAARATGFVCEVRGSPQGSGDAVPHVQDFWRSPCVKRHEKRQFVDLQNDVTVADLRSALAEGFADIEHVKRYTGLGVGTEQGRTSGTLGAAILAELRGVDPVDGRCQPAAPAVSPGNAAVAGRVCAWVQPCA